MLVLTRRESEKVLFPTLGISVELMRIQGNKARLGINAPKDIPVIRHELTERTPSELVPVGGDANRPLRELANTVRMRIDWASTALDKLRESIGAEGEKHAREIVNELYRELESLEKEANQLVEWPDTARRKHILIVEDSAVERKLMAAVLELSGLSVTTADDGHEALEFLSMHAKPDAVLLDMFMPRCDGPEFVNQVRSNSNLADLIIFAVSGFIARTPDGRRAW